MAMVGGPIREIKINTCARILAKIGGGLIREGGVYAGHYGIIV